MGEFRNYILILTYFSKVFTLKYYDSQYLSIVIYSCIEYLKKLQLIKYQLSDMYKHW